MRRSELVSLIGLLGALAGFATTAACTTNHDALARNPKGGSSGGGAGGSAGFGSSGFNAGGTPQNQAGRDNPDVEPKGKDVLTIVNGVVDAQSVALCFAHLNESGQTGPFVGKPLAALGYAGHVVLESIDGFSWADDALQPWLLAGDLGLVDGRDCAGAVELAQQEEAKLAGAAPEGEAGAAGATSEPLVMPKLRARGMAAVPAGTFSTGRSVLMVLTGCIGGPGYVDRIDGAVCGEDYAFDQPTLTPLVVKLSRQVTFDKIGLQGVHASIPSGSMDLRAAGNRGAVAFVFASQVSYGAIVPRPANRQFSALELGVAESNYGLQAVNANGQVAFEEAWPDVLAASGTETPQAAKSYTAVLLGPELLIAKKGWWNFPAFALIENDPRSERFLQ